MKSPNSLNWTNSIKLQQISSLFAGFRSSKFHFRPKLAQDWFKIDLIRSKLTKNWSWDSRRGKIIRFYQLKPLALKTTSFRGKQTVQIWNRTVDFLATKFPKIFQILAKISPYDQKTVERTKSNWFKTEWNFLKPQFWHVQKFRPKIANFWQISTISNHDCEIW